MNPPDWEELIQYLLTQAQIYLIIAGCIILAISVIYLALWWIILAKAGYPGALSLLLIFLPGFGEWILLLILASGEWPVKRELRLFREQARLPYYPPPQTYPPASYPPPGQR
jgi:hypothetical protein